MDKFALEEKVKKLEMCLKDKDKEIHKLADTTKLQQQSSIETDRLKREKNSLEYEVTRYYTLSTSLRLIFLSQFLQLFWPRP